MSDSPSISDLPLQVQFAIQSTERQIDAMSPEQLQEMAKFYMRSHYLKEQFLQGVMRDYIEAQGQLVQLQMRQERCQCDA